MLPRVSDRLPGRLRVALLALLAAGILSLAGSAARADDKEGTLKENSSAGDVKKDSALAHVPADSSYFLTILRIKEQLDLVHNSEAYKALRKLPLVEMAHKQAMAKLNEQG